MPLSSRLPLRAGARLLAGLLAALLPAAALAARGDESRAPAAAAAPEAAAADTSASRPPAETPAEKVPEKATAKAGEKAPEPQAPADTAAGKPADTAQAAAPKDSGTVDSAGLQVRFYDYVAYPVLQVITWPIEKILVPAVQLTILPAKEPLRYVLNEEVIDRTIQLISFGRNETVMLYPTLNLSPGTGSYTGLTLRHNALFGRESESLVAFGNFYVNGDWRFRSYLRASRVLGTPFDAKASIALNRQKNYGLNQPDSNTSFRFSDTSNSYGLVLSWPLIGKFQGKAGYTFRDIQYGTAPAQDDTLKSDFFRDPTGALNPQWRGLEQSWRDQIVSFGFARDTRNNPNIPLSGSTVSASWAYHFTDAKHDFHNWEAEWTGYFKLGKERYEITAAEERAAERMSLKKVLRSMELEKLRSQILSRKVLVLQVYTAEANEVEGNSAPVYALTTLGNDTPLRGYGGSRFRDYAVGAVSAEYRFPVMRLMDGTIFNEYGAVGKGIGDLDFGRLRNSWGFGIRVRRPDLFLFRAQLGFHGSHGIQTNLSVDEPF